MADEPVVDIATRIKCFSFEIIASGQSIDAGGAALDRRNAGSRFAESHRLNL